MVTNIDHQSVLARYVKNTKSATYNDLQRMKPVSGVDDVKIRGIHAFDFNGTVLKVADGHYAQRETLLIFTPSEESTKLINELKTRLEAHNILHSANYSTPFHVYDNEVERRITFIPNGISNPHSSEPPQMIDKQHLINELHQMMQERGMETPHLSPSPKMSDVASYHEIRASRKGWRNLESQILDGNVSEFSLSC